MTKKAFWWTFGFGIVGGVTGIISLVLQYTKPDQKESRTKPRVENTKLPPKLIHEKSDQKVMALDSAKKSTKILVSYDTTEQSF